MDPLLQEHKRQTAAGLLSVALTVVPSVLGIYDWIALRGLVMDLVAYFRVDPFAWQAVEYGLLIVLGVVWLGFVYYCQHFLKKRALAGSLWTSFMKMLSVQLGILSGCRLVSLSIGMPNNNAAGWTVAAVAGICALALAFLAVSLARQRDSADK